MITFLFFPVSSTIFTSSIDKINIKSLTVLLITTTSLMFVMLYVKMECT